MKNLLLLCILLLAGVATTSAQGIVRGKITDENGESVIGATVVQKDNHSVWAVADLDGNYTIKITDSLPVTLVVSFISYGSIEEKVQPKNGQVVVKNYTLRPAAHETKEVTVTAKAVRSKEYYTEMIKKNSATTLDYISSETMKKTGDANITTAVARVTGVSTNGSYLTVRGIGDRYLKTAINGSVIPTLDPFTNNIKLDLFPANLVDNVLITKTTSPDLPGDWAAAYISVVTKDYPDEFTVNFEVTAGYNSHSTFNDIVSSERSSTDWLGYDNGMRDRSHDNFVSNIESPTTYQEFVALGLGGFYNSMGVTNENWNANTDLYFRLGLVELGLLPKAQIYDQTAFEAARSAYVNGSYASDAFKIINANVPATGKSFPNNWNTSTRTAPLDFTNSLSIGNQVQLFNHPLGFIFGYRYNSSCLYDPQAQANRFRTDGSLESSTTGQNSIEVSGWSALMNLAYKFSPNHSIGMLFMPNITGTNKAQNNLDVNEETKYVLEKMQYYEERKQMIYQLKSEHYFPGQKIKAELNASYTDGNSGVPDFKNIGYYYDPTLNQYYIGGEIKNGIHRYYRYLTDNLFDSRLSIEKSLGDNPGLSRKIKIGGSYQRNDKRSDQYDYSMHMGDHSDIVLVNNDLDAFFDHSHFDIISGSNNNIPYSTINEFYVLDATAANHTFGKSEIIGGFVMLDYSLTPRLRASGGLRVEYANIYTDVARFDSLGYKPNDPRRAYSSSYPIVNPGEISTTDFLPSINIIYKIKPDDLFNIRMNYSRTLAWPSIRELSDVAFLDYDNKEFVFGNSALKPVDIHNYDMRLESYFPSGDNVSLSLFYKQFKNHIEMVRSVGLTWENVDKSFVTGIEIEGKKTVLRHLDLSANITLIKSETNFVRNRVEIADGVKTYIPMDTISRTMQGQAPYVLNGIVSYHADSIGFVVTLTYNVQGPRLVITSAIPELPDIYEMPRHLLGAKVEKKLGKHFHISLTLRDILNSPITRKYKVWNKIYDEYHYGTSYVFAINYNL